MPPNHDDLFESLADDLKETSSASSEVTASEDAFLDRQQERELKTEHIKVWRQYNKSLEQNNTERKKYAHWIFILTVAWAALIFILLFFQGFGVTKLTDKVVITLITSTTVNFFGFFLLVTKYLFNTSEHNPNQKKQKKTKSKTTKKTTRKT